LSLLLHGGVKHERSSQSIRRCLDVSDILANNLDRFPSRIKLVGECAKAGEILVMTAKRQNGEDYVPACRDCHYQQMLR